MAREFDGISCVSWASAMQLGKPPRNAGKAQEGDAVLKAVRRKKCCTMAIGIMRRNP